MKLLIDIPKEFEQHFQTDRFNDSLHRLSADTHLLAGLYEQETALMLSEAFKNAVPVSEHGRLIDADALEELFKEVINDIQEFKAFAKRPEIWKNFEYMAHASAMAVQMIEDAPTIIQAEPPKKETYESTTS